MAEEVSNDVLFCILTKLPVKSLVRFRCLSKLWMNTMDSSEFIETHMKFSAQKFISHNSIRYQNPLRHQITLKNELLDVISPKERYSPLPYGVKNLHGSSRGLLCLEFFREDVGDVLCVCNVSTRKYKVLPKKESTWDRNRLDSIKHGFGYDDIHNDYKVISIFRIIDRKRRAFKSETYVYSLEYDKWNPIETKLLDSIFSDSWVVGEGFHHGHTVHWLASNINTVIIFTVDLATEKEGMLSIPEDFINPTNMILGTFNGNLCISSRGSNSFDIWIMRESWNKVNIEIPEMNLRNNGWFLRYFEMEKLISFCDGNVDVYWYDDSNKILHKSPSSGHRGDYYGKLFPYKETLVLPFSSSAQNKFSSECHKNLSLA